MEEERDCLSIRSWSGAYCLLHMSCSSRRVNMTCDRRPMPFNSPSSHPSSGVNVLRTNAGFPLNLLAFFRLYSLSELIVLSRTWLIEVKKEAYLGDLSARVMVSCTCRLPP